MATFFTGCSNYLDIDPENFVPVEDVDYTDFDNMYAPVSGVYAKVRTGGMHWVIWPLSIVRDDDIWSGRTDDQQLLVQFGNYNFDEAQFKNRWTGEGSTNTDPSAKALTKGWNVSDQRVNSYFVESADFFRIQNITLGYSFKKVRIGGYTLPSIRLSMTADRPLTLFSANTFTPEISNTNGWDTNVYPLTSTYTFGVQINF